MKTNYIISLKTVLRTFVFSVILSLSLTSCFKDDTAEKIARHDRAMQDLILKYGFTEQDKIDDGIYVHLIGEPETGTDPIFPADNNYVVIDYETYNSAGTLIDVTDSAVAAQNGVYQTNLIYGPIYLNINNSFPGFYKAVQKVPQGKSAYMLFSWDQVGTDYEPLVYKVDLYRVIDNFKAYKDSTYIIYRNILQGVLDTVELRRDSIDGVDSVYTGITDIGDTTSSIGIEAGSTVTIFLYAYYVETDTAYVHGFPGRTFFPINNSGYSINFVKGYLSFPISKVVDEMVDRMHVNEERVILAPAELGYGETGFVNPYTNTYIIPPNMALHYLIRLRDVKN
jgi:FKBP-type peptidyl-prolyl cis-trans isomerase 2